MSRLSEDVATLDPANSGAIAAEFSMGRLKNVPTRPVQYAPPPSVPSWLLPSSNQSHESLSDREKRRRLAITNKAVFANQSECYTLKEGDAAYGKLQEYGRQL